MLNLDKIRNETLTQSSKFHREIKQMGAGPEIKLNEEEIAASDFTPGSSPEGGQHGAAWGPAV